MLVPQLQLCKRRRKFRTKELASHTRFDRCMASELNAVLYSLNKHLTFDVGHTTIIPACPQRKVKIDHILIQLPNNMTTLTSVVI